MESLNIDWRIRQSTFPKNSFDVHKLRFRTNSLPRQLHVEINIPNKTPPTPPQNITSKSRPASDDDCYSAPGKLIVNSTRPPIGRHVPVRNATTALLHQIKKQLGQLVRPELFIWRFICYKLRPVICINLQVRRRVPFRSQ